MEDLFVRVEGQGPAVLLIHGSAADHTTWSMQLGGLRKSLRLIAYDRRGTGRSPCPEGPLTVQDHARDAAALIEAHGGPMAVCGSSFGAVIALELMRSRPERVSAALLLEPPLQPTDDAPSVPAGYFAEFDGRAARDGGPAAAEFFLRLVLGDAAYERMPRVYQDRAKSLHAAIRADCEALFGYRVDYPRLREVFVPTILFGGSRSAQWYRPTLHALAKALPGAQLEILEGAGHMMQAEAFRRFNARLLQAVAGVTG